MTTDCPAPLDGQKVLVIGASSQVGWYLLPRLVAAGAEVLALSRRDQGERYAAVPALKWVTPDSLSDHLSDVTHLASAGPLSVALDLCRATPALKALSCSSSSSVLIKTDSPDPAERALMAQMLEAESALKALSADRGFILTLLQPTLLYGVGLDQNISYLARFIQRFGFLPISSQSEGLRQPLHVDDLAQALVAGLCRQNTGPVYGPICGGDTMTYRAMVERIFAALDKRPRTVDLPPALFARSLDLLARLGVVRGANGEMVRRQAADLVFDDQEVREQLRVVPRQFSPGPRDFARPGPGQLKRLSGGD